MTEAALPAWYRILRYWLDVKGGEGLSFSFLVGATRVPPGTAFADASESKAFAADLYREIRTANIERFVAHVHGCHNIRGDVVTLEYGVQVGFYPFPSFAEIWTFYGAAIVSGDFSLERGKFRQMRSDEIAWVQKALGE